MFFGNIVIIIIIVPSHNIHIFPYTPDILINIVVVVVVVSILFAKLIKIYKQERVRKKKYNKSKVFSGHVVN